MMQKLIIDYPPEDKKKPFNNRDLLEDKQLSEQSLSRRDSVGSDRNSPTMARLQLPIKQPQSNSNISIPTSQQRQEEQVSQKIKTVSSEVPQQNITPGYKTYQIDEHNAQYDYIKGMFSEEEIREAFNVLDMNKDQGITAEDLSFFLDFIGEKATNEEIEEMIRMCDFDGSGEVHFDEFLKMARGLSLTPLGQAYPPNRELVEKRTQLNQMMMEKEIQEVAKKGKITPAMVEEIKKNEILSPHFGQDESSKTMFQSINNIAAQSGIKKIPRQVPGQLIKAIRSEEGLITSSNKQKSTLTQKEIMTQRKANAIKFISEKKLDQKQLYSLFEKINKLDIVEKCSYEDFVQALELTDGHWTKQIFNSMTESPLREEYVKGADEMLLEQTVNLKFAFLSILGVINCRKHDKLELAYMIMDPDKNGYITLDDLIQLLIYLYCITDVAIIEQKIMKMSAKKGLRQSDIIKRDLYIGMINEYGQVFEPV